MDPIRSVCEGPATECEDANACSVVGAVLTTASDKVTRVLDLPVIVEVAGRLEEPSLAGRSAIGSLRHRLGEENGPSSMPLFLGFENIRVTTGMESWRRPFQSCR
jgi:hypothetical protein